jgi:hypothetical protein
MGAGRWVGRGDKNAADQAGRRRDALMLDTVQMDGVVVIGEGEKDEAPMLFNGESVGSGFGPAVDVAVDPLEGTRLTAYGQQNAIAVIAVAERGTMFFPGAAVYMEKIATGPEAADAIDLDATPAENVNRVAEAKGKSPRDVTVIVLERPRPRAADRRAPRGGARVTAHPRRRRRPRDRGRARRHRDSRPPDGRRRHARGRDRGCRDQVPRRRAPGPALAARRRGAREARGGRLRRPPRSAHRRPRRGGERLRRGDGRHVGRAAERLCATRATASSPSRW